MLAVQLFVHLCKVNAYTTKSDTIQIYAITSFENVFAVPSYMLELLVSYIFEILFPLLFLNAQGRSFYENG